MVVRTMCRRPARLISTTTDKVAVRPWVSSLVGSEILPSRFQEVAAFDDLDFSALPDAVVLKASHGSGMTVVITGRPPSSRPVVWDARVVVLDGPSHAVDRNALRAIADRWLDTDYSEVCGERHYADIPRRLVTEELLGSAEDPLIEYGIYCVKGSVVFAQVCQGDDLYRAVDRDYRPLNIGGATGTLPTGDLPPEPTYFRRMVSIAETLASPFECVRIDLFSTRGRIIFSEITHTTMGGRTRFVPEEFGAVFGRFWRGDRTIPERHYS